MSRVFEKLDGPPAYTARAEDDKLAVEVCEPPQPNPLFEPADKQRHFAILQYMVNDRFKKLAAILVLVILLIVGVLAVLLFVVVGVGRSPETITANPTTATTVISSVTTTLPFVKTTAVYRTTPTAAKATSKDPDGTTTTITTSAKALTTTATSSRWNTTTVTNAANTSDTTRIQTTTLMRTSTKPPGCSAATTTTGKAGLTCLLMIDMQSLGISPAAINTYKKYFNFAILVACRLNKVFGFFGSVDNFGYSSGFVDHNTYSPNEYEDIMNTVFPIDGTDDSIDLDLKDVDESLTSADWWPSTYAYTCMIFFSAAPEAEYVGTTIKAKYDNFNTVVGVLIGGAPSIPGLTNPVDASSLSNENALEIVQRLQDIVYG